MRKENIGCSSKYPQDIRKQSTMVKIQWHGIHFENRDNTKSIYTSYKRHHNYKYNIKLTSIKMIHNDFEFHKKHFKS